VGRISVRRGPALSWHSSLGRHRPATGRPSAPNGQPQLIQLVGSNKRVDRLDLYDVLSSMRVAVHIIERLVEDVPELAMAFGKVRQELFARYERYLRARGEAEHAVWRNR
jgi:hypothetical protein